MLDSEFALLTYCPAAQHEAQSALISSTILTIATRQQVPSTGALDCTRLGSLRAHEVTCQCAGRYHSDLCRLVTSEGDVSAERKRSEHPDCWPVHRGASTIVPVLVGSWFPSPLSDSSNCPGDCGWPGTAGYAGAPGGLVYPASHVAIWRSRFFVAEKQWTAKTMQTVPGLLTLS